jgi:phosphoserine phosphatase RsbU/P
MGHVMSGRLRRAALGSLPGLTIAVIVVADLQVGHSVVLGLVVVAPLLAANVAGPRVTAAYAALALVVGALLGLAKHLYVSGEALLAQEIRLGVIAVMGVVGVLLSRYRVERERRLTQVTKVAEAAQRAILLPVPAELGPVRIAVHYESAASDAMVGGDLYGFVVTPHGLRVLIGDVRGKGLDAVRMTAQVLATFRERANDDRQLPTLMSRLDSTVTRAAETDEDFVTAVLVQVAYDGRVVVANAGHPAPVLVSHAGAHWIEPDPVCPPLGLGGAGNASCLTMAPSDRLLLYTDGLTEARDPRTRHFYPDERIIEPLAAAALVTDALTGLLEGVLDWSGGALHDDLALVLIEYHPERNQETAAETADLASVPSV